jgi:hypothetical protein
VKIVIKVIDRVPTITRRVKFFYYSLDCWLCSCEINHHAIHCSLRLGLIAWSYDSCHVLWVQCNVVGWRVGEDEGKDDMTLDAWCNGQLYICTYDCVLAENTHYWYISHWSRVNHSIQRWADLTVVCHRIIVYEADSIFNMHHMFTCILLLIIIEQSR